MKKHKDTLGRIDLFIERTGCYMYEHMTDFWPRTLTKLREIRINFTDINHARSIRIPEIAGFSTEVHADSGLVTFRKRDLSGLGAFRRMDLSSSTRSSVR